MALLFALIGAGAAGSFLAIGAAANARLKQILHCAIALWAVPKAIAAAAINFIVGFSVLTLLLPSRQKITYSLLPLLPLLPLPPLLPLLSQHRYS